MKVFNKRSYEPLPLSKTKPNNTFPCRKKKLSEKLSTAPHCAHLFARLETVPSASPLGNIVLDIRILPFTFLPGSIGDTALSSA